MKSLHELFETVADQTTFLEFVKALEADKRASTEAEARQPSPRWSPAAGDWENVTIEGFLESALAWAADSNFGAAQLPQDVSPWKRMAVFLYMGKIYE